MGVLRLIVCLDDLRCVAAVIEIEGVADRLCERIEFYISY
jgi:hypothetical protein